MIPNSSGKQNPNETLQILRDNIRVILEQSQQEFKEIKLLLEQSQLELTKLQQRNTNITLRLKQTLAQMETVSKTDLRQAYDSALDSQQRLFIIRGQIDKLRSDQVHIERTINILNQAYPTLEVLSGEHDNKPKGLSAMAQTVEMIIQAQEAERQRLARQMHDGPAQALSNFILQTEIAMRYFENDPSKAKDELSSIRVSAATTFQKVRDFIFELRPMMLDDLGLTPTLSRYVESLKNQSGIDIHLVYSGVEQRLESYLEVLIFRAIQELLGNAVRFSQATQIKVQIDISDTLVRVNVEDNGRGFDTELITEKGGMGLKVIRDRIEMLDGTIEVHSVIGQGTHIMFQIPAWKPAVFA